MQKDLEVNKNQIQRRSDLKKPISLAQYDQDNQTNSNIDLNHISPLHNTPHKPSSPHHQQHSASPSLEETSAIIRKISPRDPRGYKEREPERKQLKLQQYAGLMDIIEKFHEIMKPIIEEEKKKPKAMLPGQYKDYPNKDGPLFFYPPKNYHPIPIPRPKDLNLSEEQWKQFDEDVREGVVPYQEAIGLIVFTAEQIVQSETESKDQKQLTNQIERIVADGTDDNEDNDQSEHTIEPKYFTSGNDGFRVNDSATQLQATVNGEANPEINISKISANTPPHNVSGSDALGKNGCGTQLQVAANGNEHLNHQTIVNTGNEDNNEHTNDNRTGGQQSNQGSKNETQHVQDNENTKLGQIGSSHTTSSEQQLRNPNILQHKGQPPLITTPPELGQVKGKVVVPKQRTQPTNDNDTRSKTGQLKSICNKSSGSPEARANFDTPNHFIPQQEQKKKADVAPVTEDKSAKHSKGNKTSAGSKKQKQGFNFENQIEIDPDSGTDQPDQLD
ncbi:MAG: hypothetical protein EZS28_018407 [Streblomastix strix]|uniref:Uncharacterized protein n=1 Tax=Streblomastix strix TaxID=222440 RepID=A0A5J4VUI6_9EUKA|nr:MAG: hypothetical protein EZS28_018407 [Streblomastix strix]